MQPVDSSQAEPIVFVVDDDESIRQSLEWLLSSVGLRVQTFASAAAFLESGACTRAGCLVLDVRMPVVSGLDLQRTLHQRGVHLPVIIITGHGDVPSAVRAMRAGAIDFLEKPFNDQVLLDRVQQAIAIDARVRAETRRKEDFRGRLSRLSPREKEVLQMVVAGSPNKVIAAELRLSQKTVEHHRASVMHKMGVSSLAELVAHVITSGAMSENTHAAG